MKEVIIQVPEKKYRFLKELLNNLDFKTEIETRTKDSLRKDIAQAVHEMNMVKKGKLKARPVKDLWMSYEVLTIPQFDKEAKRLSKKFPTFRNDLAALTNELSSNPFIGTPIGNHCYKIRLAIKSKGTGKSGGARVITNLIVVEKKVFLLSVYDKSEQENIGDKELKKLLAQIGR